MTDPISEKITSLVSADAFTKTCRRGFVKIDDLIIPISATIPTSNRKLEWPAKRSIRSRRITRWIPRFVRSYAIEIAYITSQDYHTVSREISILDEHKKVLTKGMLPEDYFWPEAAIVLLKIPFSRP